jgi:hypothetical protein
MARTEQIPSRNAKHEDEVTRGGNPTSAESGDVTDGEGFGPGARYTATLRERANKSLNRNAGPSRPSANAGELPSVTQGARKTGRI